MKDGVPKRGEILRLNFDPRKGHEQGGFRPAVVVSNSIYNEHSSTIVVCPISSRVRDWPFVVSLPETATVRGAVLVDQVRVIDWKARSARQAGTCSQDVMAKIDERLDVLFRGVARAESKQTI
ncbi:MAG TPA: type II toxin-antitoxin system PemK/MazF family toxin [Rhizomicrobium sp.]